MEKDPIWWILKGVLMVGGAVSAASFVAGFALAAGFGVGGDIS